jgi:hypothetical protein
MDDFAVDCRQAVTSERASQDRRKDRRETQAKVFFARFAAFAY